MPEQKFSSIDELVAFSSQIAKDKVKQLSQSGKLTLMDIAEYLGAGTPTAPGSGTPLYTALDNLNKEGVVSNSLFTKLADAAKAIEDDSTTFTLEEMSNAFAPTDMPALPSVGPLIQQAFDAVLSTQPLTKAPKMIVQALRGAGLMPKGTTLGRKRDDPLFHGTPSESDAAEILAAGLTRGRSAELGIPGTSTSRDPKVSAGFAQVQDPRIQSRLMRVETEPELKARTLNLSPGEYAAPSQETLDLIMSGEVATSKPQSYFVEHETFFPAGSRERFTSPRTLTRQERVQVQRVLADSDKFFRDYERIREDAINTPYEEVLSVLQSGVRSLSKTTRAHVWKQISNATSPYAEGPGLSLFSQANNVRELYELMQTEVVNAKDDPSNEARLKVNDAYRSYIRARERLYQQVESLAERTPALKRRSTSGR